MDQRWGQDAGDVPQSRCIFKRPRAWNLGDILLLHRCKCLVRAPTISRHEQRNHSVSRSKSCHLVASGLNNTRAVQARHERPRCDSVTLIDHLEVSWINGNSLEPNGDLSWSDCTWLWGRNDLQRSTFLSHEAFTDVRRHPGRCRGLVSDEPVSIRLCDHNVYVGHVPETDL